MLKYLINFFFYHAGWAEIYYSVIPDRAEKINESTSYNLWEGNRVKWSLKRKLLFIMIIIILFIATFLDIKYQGLFFKLLPNSIKSYLADIF